MSHPCNPSSSSPAAARGLLAPVRTRGGRESADLATEASFWGRGKMQKDDPVNRVHDQSFKLVLS